MPRGTDRVAEVVEAVEEADQVVARARVRRRVCLLELDPTPDAGLFRGHERSPLELLDDAVERR